MKSLLFGFFLAFSVGNSLAQSTCDKVDQYRIFYGNGIRAADPATEFKNAYLLRDRLGTDLDGTSIVYDMAYNSSESDLIDLLQSFEQKREEYYSQFFLWLNDLGLAPDWFNQELQAILLTATAVKASDVFTHAEQYTRALNAGEKVLVVAHSQGNFYVNDAKKILETSSPQLPMTSFGIFGIATPASNVGGEAGPYYTNDRDIIGYVPDSLPEDWQLRYASDKRLADDIGAVEAHLFAQTYFSETYDILPALIQGIKASLGKLADPVPDCPDPPPPPPPGSLPGPLFTAFVITASRCGFPAFTQTGTLEFNALGDIQGTGCFASVFFPSDDNYTYSQNPAGVNALFVGSANSNNLTTNTGGPTATVAWSPSIPQSRDVTYDRPLQIDAQGRHADWVRFITGKTCDAYYPGTTEIFPDSHVEISGDLVSIMQGAQVLASRSLFDLFSANPVYSESHGGPFTPDGGIRSYSSAVGGLLNYMYVELPDDRDVGIFEFAAAMDVVSRRSDYMGCRNFRP